MDNQIKISLNHLLSQFHHSTNSLFSDMVLQAELPSSFTATALVQLQYENSNSWALHQNRYV